MCGNPFSVRSCTIPAIRKRTDIQCTQFESVRLYFSRQSFSLCDSCRPNSQHHSTTPEPELLAFMLATVRDRRLASIYIINSPYVRGITLTSWSTSNE